MNRFPEHAIYALISFICPIAAYQGTLLYQSIANSEYWQSLTPGENVTGALMAFSEITQLIVSLVIGCTVGLLFAVLSIRRHQVWSVGLIALVFNALPFVFVTSLLIKGMVFGL